MPTVAAVEPAMAASSVLAVARSTLPGGIVFDGSRPFVPVSMPMERVVAVGVLAVGAEEGLCMCSIT